MSREEMHRVRALSHRGKWLQNSTPDSPRSGVPQLNVLLQRLLNENTELRTTGNIVDRADVTTTLVRCAHAPVEAHDLVAHWIDVIGRVEILQLMREQLADTEKNERSYAEKMVVLGVVHHRGDLTIFVAINVNATINGQRGQFVIFLVLLDVLGAKSGLKEDKENR